MNYETLMHQDKLIEFITNPAWWSVIATFAAAIVAARITSKFGKRQNELQEQQLKIQERQNDLQEQQVKLQEQQLRSEEYNVYRGIYELIFSIHKSVEGFVMKIYSIIAAGENVKVWTWESIRQEISKLKTDIESKSIDIDLKFSEYDYLPEAYKLILSLMDGTVNRFERVENNGLINSSIKVDTSTMVSNINKGNKCMLLLIKENIIDEKENKDLIDAITVIYSQYKNVSDIDFLSKIKSKI